MVPLPRTAPDDRATAVDPLIRGQSEVTGIRRFDTPNVEIARVPVGKLAVQFFVSLASVGVHNRESLFRDPNAFALQLVQH
jgi:hypothetical protein